MRRVTRWRAASTPASLPKRLGRARRTSDLPAIMLCFLAGFFFTVSCAASSARPQVMAPHRNQRTDTTTGNNRALMVWFLTYGSGLLQLLHQELLHELDLGHAFGLAHDGAFDGVRRFDLAFLIIGDGL